MEINEKLEWNKRIRKYDGDNTFIISVQKQLKNNKYLEKITVGKRSYKILSDKQYSVVKDILGDED